MFTRLEKYTEYNVRVMSKNKLGYSLPSEIVKVSSKGAGILYIALFTVVDVITMIFPFKKYVVVVNYNHAYIVYRCNNPLATFEESS